jgi:hypothetical protein
VSADEDRVHGILEELVRQRRQLEGAPGARRLLQANGRAIAYWRGELAAARRVGASRPGYTGQRSRM